MEDAIQKKTTNSKGTIFISNFCQFNLISCFFFFFSWNRWKFLNEPKLLNGTVYLYITLNKRVHFQPLITSHILHIYGLSPQLQTSRCFFYLLQEKTESTLLIFGQFCLPALKTFQQQQRKHSFYLN